MRIACIGTGWYPQNPGGLEKYVHGMTRASLNAGDEVDLFVTGDPKVDGERVRAYSIGDPRTPLWKRMMDARFAFAKHFQEPYDVVNIHFAMNALPLIPFIKHRTPRVVHFHGPWAAESRAEGGGAFASSMKAALERFVYARSDRFIVLSTAFKEILQGYGVDAARIHVIPMGIDVDFFKPPSDRHTVRATLGWPLTPTIFFTARRLINRVGLLQLVDAARIVRSANDNFLIKIAGKGPLREELETAIADRGLTDCVELLGFVSEERLVQCYQAADVTVLPSQSLEGFGTIISESLACGTPVIVTPIGGMPEALTAFAKELITDSPAPVDIAARMDAVLRGTLQLPGSEQSRAYARQNFDWTVVYRRARNVFLDVATP